MQTEVYCMQCSIQMKKLHNIKGMDIYACPRCNASVAVKDWRPCVDVSNSTTLSWDEAHRAVYLGPQDISPIVRKPQDDKK